MIDGYLTETQVADTLDRTTRTLRLWRARGLGPAFTRVGNNVVYRDQAIRDWLLRNEVQPVRAKRR
jgi:DNA-binding transcriptional MerR regulator